MNDARRLLGCLPLHLEVSLSDEKCFVIETANGIKKLSSFRMCGMR
jgi:hypothetical protein